MESPREATKINKLPTQEQQQIYVSIRQYLLEPDTYPISEQLFSQIFSIIQGRVIPRNQISEEAQKSMNIYLKKHKQIESLPWRSEIIRNKKILICNLYDMFLQAEFGTVHNAVISGQIGDLLISYYKDILQNLSEQLFKWKILVICVEIVGIHICEMLQKNKDNIIYTLANRQRCPYIENHRDFFISNQDMINRVFNGQLCLMNGFVDDIKPIIINYLNMQSLLEVTNKNYSDKQCILACFSKDYNGEGSLYFGGKLKLKQVINENLAGRLAIENTFHELDVYQTFNKLNSREKIGDVMVSQKKQQILGWSLSTLPQQFQYQINCVFEKLPIFLKPKSNGDILSFQRIQHFPTFSYHIIKPRYAEGPFLTECTLAIYNTGKLPVQIISFYQTGHENLVIHPLDFEVQYLIKNKIKYTKGLITSKNLAIVPANHHYLIGCTQNQEIGFVQLIQWSIIPKVGKEIQNFLEASSKKLESFRGQFNMLPRSLILFDYLSHELSFLKKTPQIPEIISQFLSKILVEEEDIIFQAIKKCPGSKITPFSVSEDNKFCNYCLGQIVNYYAVIKSIKKQLICMYCLQKNFANETQLHLKVKFKALYAPQDLRYPLNLAKLFQKRKISANQLQNRYQQNICCGKFIGAIETEVCQGKVAIPDDMNKQKQIQYQRNKCSQKYFTNKLCSYGIVPIDTLFELSALKIPKNEEQKKTIQKQLQKLSKMVTDKQQLKCKLFPKYSNQNMILKAMCYLQNLAGLL